MHRSRGFRTIVALLAVLALAPVSGVDAAGLSTLPQVAVPAPGYDISWPQCGAAYPASPAFGIVGVNQGIVFSANPCLATELTWAGNASAGLYANTANPGPALSSHWPTGQTSPQVCSATSNDTAACAYDYGYNAAANSYADAVAAFAALGLPASPAGNPWWLDVETSNSWRSDVALNVAALSGAAYYLGSVAHVASLGIYSTGYQWGVITGGTSAFSAYPSWVAGAANAAGAVANCTGAGFTGGGVALAQYLSGGFDADVLCSAATPVLTSVSITPASVSVQTGKTVQFSAVALDQFGGRMSPQPAFAWTASGGGTISASGLFTAGSAAGGPFLVTGSSGGLSATSSVTVTSVPADFSLTVGPASVSVKRGGTATFTVTTTLSNGLTGPVSLSLRGQPAGSTVTFTPTATTGKTTLTVKTSGSGPRGTFTLTVTGKVGSLTHTATAKLSVTR